MMILQNATIMLLNSLNLLPLTAPTASHPRCHRRGPILPGALKTSKRISFQFIFLWISVIINNILYLNQIYVYFKQFIGLRYNKHVSRTNYLLVKQIYLFSIYFT